MKDSLLTRFLADNVVADDQAYADDAMANYDAEAEVLQEKKGKHVFVLLIFFILLAMVGYYALRSYVFKKRAKLDLAESDGNVGEYKTPQEAGVNV
jgi:flagellar basal body-associated protein FliL